VFYKPVGLTRTQASRTSASIRDPVDARVPQRWLHGGGAWLPRWRGPAPGGGGVFDL